MPAGAVRSLERKARLEVVATSGALNSLLSMPVTKPLSPILSILSPFLLPLIALSGPSRAPILRSSATSSCSFPPTKEGVALLLKLQGAQSIFASCCLQYLCSPPSLWPPLGAECYLGGSCTRFADRSRSRDCSESQGRDPQTPRTWATSLYFVVLRCTSSGALRTFGLGGSFVSLEDVAAF